MKYPAYRKHFPRFFNAQLAEMKRHQPNKGDEWRSCTSEELMDMYDNVSRELHARYEVGDFEGTRVQAVDVANILAMLHTVLEVEVK